MTMDYIEGYTYMTYTTSGTKYKVCLHDRTYITHVA